MKSKLARMLTLMLAALAAAAAIWGGCLLVSRNFLFWNGVLLARDAQSLTLTGRPMKNLDRLLELTRLEQLDLRGTGLTVEQYQWLRQEMPRCAVEWDVPVAGGFYSRDTQSITVKALSEADIYALQYLPKLKNIDASGWEDYPRILEFTQAYPQYRLRYQVELAGEQWEADQPALMLRDADAQELEQKLPLFSRLESVLLTGQLPPRQELKALQDAFPDIFFLWKMDAFGQELETDMTALNLAGMSLGSARELGELLAYFPGLEVVELSGTDIPQQELLELARSYPSIQFLFDIQIGDRWFHTGDTELDLSNIPFSDTAEVEALLPAFHQLEKVVMCQCGIPSPEMDALNKRHGDIRFVWSVNLAGVEFRTDAVHFTPNRWGLKCTDDNIADLQYCTDMVCVDIGHATMVTRCDWVRNMPCLKYLVLAETGISDLTPLEGLDNLVFLELFLSKVKDYSPLVKLKNLEDLNLCYTTGDPTPIGKMTWLKRLWWSGNWKERTTLPKLLTDTETNFLSRSSTGDGWRTGQHYYEMRDFIGMAYMTG